MSKSSLLAAALDGLGLDAGAAHRPRAHAATALPAAARTSFQTLKDPAQGGSTHIPVVDTVLEELDNFQKAFEDYQRAKGALPGSLQDAWKQIYDQKDSLGKVSDFLDSCHKHEKALVGPRPEDMGDPDAKAEMENSVSAYINQVAEQGNELVSLCDQSAFEVTGDNGMAEQVLDLIKKLDGVDAKIVEITTGEVAPVEEVQQALAPLPPEAIVLLLQSQTAPPSPEGRRRKTCRGGGGRAVARVTQPWKLPRRQLLPLGLGLGPSSRGLSNLGSSGCATFL